MQSSAVATETTLQTEVCLNCGTPLAGPYCSSCGQKAPDQDLTLRELVREATAELTHWEGKVPQTLKTLLFKPGALTRDFFAGRRARWLAPLRLYLICSVAYFVSDALAENITHRSERAAAKMLVTAPDGRRRLTPAARVELEQELPARMFGMPRIERALANNAQFSRTIESAYPKAMFVLLPYFAFLTFIFWRGRQAHYPAHLYVALHLHAAWFAILAITLILTAFVSSLAVLSTVGSIALIYVILYSLVALRRVFADSWPKTIAKAAAVGLVYFAGLSAMGLVILSYALLRA